MKTKYFLIVAFLYLLHTSVAQNAQQEFHVVQKQTQHFNWQKISTKNVEIYYYEGGKPLADAAAAYSDKEYLRISELLGYYEFEKLKLVLYVNPAHKKQSNLNQNYFNNPSGGESYYLKNCAEVAFGGTLIDFKKEISFQIAHSIVNQMLYGSGIKEIVKSSYHLAYPEWITKGLPEYIAQGWSVKLDEYMFSAKIKGNLQFLNRLKGDDAKQMGHSVWNYLAEAYSPITLGNVLLVFRTTREIEVALSSSLDVGAKQFFNEWKSYYEKNNEHIISNLPSIVQQNELINFKLKNEIDKLSISHDGTKIAYLKKNKITIINSENNQKINNHKFKNHHSTNSETLIKWKNNQDVVLVYRSFGETNIWYNLKNKLPLFYSSKDNLIMKNFLEKDFWGTKKTELGKFDNIQNMNFSKDGSQIVLSASSGGKNDLYVMVPDIKKTYRITNDIYDDIDPYFINDNEIIFATNRLNDSANYQNNFKEIEDNYDLYLYDLKNKTKPMHQLTYGLGNEIKPIALNDSVVFFINENSGIRSISSINAHSREQFDVIVGQENIKNIFISNSNLLAQINNEIYTLNYDLTDSLLNSFKTKRQLILENRTLSSKISNNLNHSRGWISKLLDTSATKISTSKYQTNLSTKKVTTAFAIDPIYGAGIVLGTTLTDFFENYRLNANVFALSDFSSSIITLELENKKGKIDKKIAYKRNNIFFTENEFFTKYGMQSLEFSFGIPIAHQLSLYVKPTLFEATKTDIFAIVPPVKSTKNALLSMDLVFNNTRVLGANRLLGTRFKLSFLTNYGILVNELDELYLAKQENFSRINVDFRNYKKVLKGITWANRVAVGKSFGPAAKTFQFGGMDNWFFPRMALNELPQNGSFDATNLFYTSFVTNVRGFGYNARNGNAFMLYNSELRIPLQTIFGVSKSNSEFVNNLQLNLFSDIGSAWSGLNPFNENNSFNTKKIDNGDSFVILVKNYRNPIVMSYGIGVRTIVFGTYLKADLGFGIEEIERQKTTFMITMGHDF